MIKTEYLKQIEALTKANGLIWAVIEDLYTSFDNFPSEVTDEDLEYQDKLIALSEDLRAIIKSTN